MKQTNNAIKFLMAQYRAIFKNANIAMLAAIAASALAAGQAQGAGLANWSEIADGGSYDATADDADHKLAIVGSDGKMSHAGFAITVSGTGHTIKGAKGFNDFAVTGDKASITLTGDDAAATTLVIGNGTPADDDVANITLKELKALGGTLSIYGGAKDNVTSTVAADSIVIGQAPAKAAATAVVALGKNAVLGSETTTTSFTIGNGGELKFSGAGAKAVSKNGIVLNGGAITAAESSAGTITGGLTVKAGKLDVANKGTLTIDNLKVSNKGEVGVSGGDTGGKLNVTGLVVESGTVNVAGGAVAGTLTVSDKLEVTGGKVAIATGATAGGAVVVEGKTNFTNGKLNIASKGSLTLKDDATFAKGTIEAVNATDGAVAVDTTNNEVDLTIYQEDLKKVLGGKFTASGTNNFNLVLSDAGQNLNLLDSTLVNSDGVSKIAMTGGGVANIKTDGAATYLKGQFNSATGYDFKTMTVGASNKFKISGGATVTVHNGITVSGDAAQTSLTVEEGTLNLDGSGSVASKTLAVSGASANLNVTGKWSVNDLTLNQGTTELTDAELTIAGTLTSDNASGKLNASGSKIFVDGKNSGLKVTNGKITLNNASELHVDVADVLNGTALNNTNLAAGKLDSDANSKLVLKAEQAVKMTKDQFKKFATDTGFKGIIDGITLTDHNVSGTQTLDKLVTNGTAGQEDVTASVGNTAVSGNYTVGNAQLSEATDTSLELGAGGNLTLVDASIGTNNKGNFVSKKDGKVADVVMKDSNTLTLAGSGNIGSIKTDNDGKGQVTFGTASKGNVTVEGSLGADTKALAEVTTNGSNVTVSGGDVYTHNINLNGGSLTLGEGKNVVLGAGKAGLKSTINGDLTANELSFKASSTGTLAIAGGADVDLKKLSGTTGIKIQIGKDGTSVKDSSTASVYADTLELGSGSIFVDPADGLPYSLLVVNNLKQTGPVTNDKVAGELNGTVNVGNNAVFGVGFNNKQEVIDAVAAYTKPTGSLNADHFNSALVLNKPVTLTKNDGLYVGKNATDASAQANKVTFESGAGLVITDNVFSDVNGKKSGAAITVNTDATVNVSGAKLVFVGDFTGADRGLQIFSGTTSITGAMTSQSANGYLSGTTTNTGTIDLEFDREKAVAANAFGAASAPVRNLLLDKLDGKIAKSVAAGYDLISLVATSTKDGVLADAAAHAATYAGAQQAAVLSVTTMADAMFGRVGAVGVEAASIAATGSQANGGVWLTPMYKSMDSDGFNAQGASYGSDVDLSGVAFGTDTVNGNMRFGAVFNIGSGDAEGKVNGNGLKDEFDYYGFGIYSAMGFGNFALVGDASMTVISHDVEGHGLNGEADTTAVTMGLTGQYTVATPAVDVTPHLGARFIRLNTESYDLVGADGIVATTDFDVQNVFSIPLGVTLSKGFVAGGWTLAPSADLSVTFNTGDTEAKSTTTFTGVKAINLNTEVLDKVQYGVTLGLGAQYGAFGTSFGINYTGSSNTDSFGVNAQARYMF